MLVVVLVNIMEFKLTPFPPPSSLVVAKFMYWLSQVVLEFPP